MEDKMKTAKITKAQAIKQARVDVTTNSTWNEKMRMWASTQNPRTPTQLKTARISYALKLIGVDPCDADQYSYNCYGLSFREAVYKY
jgi:hypothetical protein